MENEINSTITLLGVGNILLSDEGLGVHIVNQFKEDYVCNPPVNVIDGGTMGMELLSYMRGMKKLILVDAINGGEVAGTVYEFPHEEMNTYFTDRISVHEVGMQDILRIRALQEDPLEDATVVGIEPSSLELGLEMTPVVASSIPKVIEIIRRILTEWGIEVAKR